MIRLLICRNGAQTTVTTTDEPKQKIESAMASGEPELIKVPNYDPHDDLEGHTLIRANEILTAVWMPQDWVDEKVREAQQAQQGPSISRPQMGVPPGLGGEPRH